MPVNLPLLPPQQALVDQSGVPTAIYQQWWQQVVEQVSDSVDAIAQALQAAIDAQSAADEAQDTAIDAATQAAQAALDASNAATAAATAQTTANGKLSPDAADARYVQKNTSAIWGASSGDADRSSYASYTAPTISDPPTQTEVQGIADAVQALGQHMVAMISDLRASGALSS